MDDKKYILVSLEDDKTINIANVLGNKTCKKILDFLAEKEASEKDIADSLKIPMNTIEYNLKKLLEADLIEKSKNYFWSQRGKRIDVYKVSNKSIIISPKSRISSKLKSILPVVLLTGVGVFLVKTLSSTFTSSLDSTNLPVQEAAKSVADFAVEATPVFQPAFPIWVWFAYGGLLAMVIFTILNWRKL